MPLREFIDMVERGNWLILDTETTGLDRPAEICEIAVIAPDTSVVLRTLLKPTIRIPQAAIEVHGINDGLVADKPQWPDIKPQFLEAIAGKDVIVYNAKFDRKLIHWTDEAFGFAHFDYHVIAKWYCAMEAYAEFHGEIHPHYGSYVWQGLVKACIQMGLAIDAAHSAVGDCRMTRALVLAMAERCADDWKPLALGGGVHLK